MNKRLEKRIEDMLSGEEDKNALVAFQKNLNDCEIVDYFQTDIIGGRHVKMVLTKEGNIFIQQTSYQLLVKDEGYKPTRMLLSPETFSFLLEAMLHGEKQFNLNRSENLKKLTNDKNVVYKKTMSL